MEGGLGVAFLILKHMKRFIFIAFFFIGIAATAFAQTNLVSQYSLPLDTVANTATKYLTVSTALNSFYKTTEVALTYTKISGTVAGTATLEYSLDGTNYYSLKRDSIYTATDVTSQTFGWSIKDVAVKYIRVKVTGVGTMSAQVKAKIHARKENS